VVLKISLKKKRGTKKGDDESLRRGFESGVVELVVKSHSWW